MKVAIGLKAHSGWAALVVIGKRDGNITVVDRRRIELVEQEWAKQPYHAAKRAKPDAARGIVQRGVEAAQRIAVREMQEAVRRQLDQGNQVMACAVLVGDPMPEWSVEEILAVHFRMHKAEGVLFKEALVRAAKACRLKLVSIPEKSLGKYSEAASDASESDLAKEISALGKIVGPPWGKDQKDAALAAAIALGGARSSRDGDGNE